MNKELLIEALEVAVNHYEYEGDRNKSDALAILIFDIKESKTYEDGYSDGVADTLSELSEVYGDGIQETDLWAEHMTTEKESI